MQYTETPEEYRLLLSTQNAEDSPLNLGAPAKPYESTEDRGRSLIHSQNNDASIDAEVHKST